MEVTPMVVTSMELGDSLIMSLVCMGVVFLVLLSIMLMIMALSAFNKMAPQKAAVPVSAPVVAAPAPVSNVPETVSAEPEVVAAITAVISTMVREPIADIRITKID